MAALALALGLLSGAALAQDPKLEADAKVFGDKRRTKIGGALARPAFNQIKKMMDPAEVGAAPLLGIDGLVFVGHGRSNARAMFSAVRVARQVASTDLLSSLRQAIQSRLANLPELTTEKST